jgi:choline dehydrogenase-like flavoprotein
LIDPYPTLIIESKDITKPVRETADVCIIGSGCGGGASAKVLSDTGKKVIVVEEGNYFRTEDLQPTEEFAFSNLYRQRAGQATDNVAVTVLQGKCIGGSSTVNWTTSLRTPEFVLERWAKDFGVDGLTVHDLDPYFARVERYLNVHVEPDENHNLQNRIILDGARKLGYRAKANGRNTKDCAQIGACGFGCPIGAKMSVDVTYIPDAAKSGATIYSGFRADRIEVSGNSKRVSGAVLDPATQKVKFDFIIEVPVVIVSASATFSPLLLLKSNLANSSGQVGRHLTFHLTSALLGIFDRKMGPSQGIPQSALCDEFLNKNGDGGGFWMEAVPATPALAALALPGFGNAHRSLMRQYTNMGATIVLVKEIDSEGRVTVNDYGRPSISYELGARDRGYLKQGIKATAEVQFAAGAKEVLTLHTRKTSFKSVDDIDKALAAADWGSNEIALYSAHPLGTCRMGKDPRTSVVDSHCQTHDVRGLFVIDGSVTPTSLGVNPQITILSIAEKSAEWIAENFRRISG